MCFEINVERMDSIDNRQKPIQRQKNTVKEQIEKIGFNSISLVFYQNFHMIRFLLKNKNKTEFT